jgi:Anion-transporting ATPase
VGFAPSTTTGSIGPKGTTGPTESNLLGKRLLIVTGKGGVGKSTVAAALGWAAASQGKRVLLCEFDAKGDLAVVLEGVGARNQEPLRFAPREVHPGLWAMAMDPEESLKEYLRLNLRLPFITRIGALSSAFDFLANAAPGVREIVTIGKVAYEARLRQFDIVIVDATSTGHVIGQLRAPQAINELVGVGLIRSQTEWMLDILGDARITGLVVVSTLEEMPVTETLELLEKVADQTNVRPLCVVANRILPAPFTTAGEKVFSRMRTDPTLLGLSNVEMAADIIAGVALSEDLRSQRAEQLQRLTGGVGALPVALVPELFDVAAGLPMTRTVADQLTDELGL